jgi:hypothetical protein
MNRIGPKDVARAVQTTRSLHHEVGQLMNDLGHEPSRASRAAMELRTFDHRGSVRTVYSLGTMLLEVAADQLMAFAKTVTEPVQTIAPWTCVRAVIEASALSAWLLDPDLDAKTRVQRSFAFRFEGLSQQVKFVQTQGDESAKTKVLARIRDVEREALQLGFPKIRSSKGVRTGIAQRMPSITEVISQSLNEEPVYRILSAMAHAHSWALVQLSFRRMHDDIPRMVETKSDVVGCHLFEKNVEPVSVGFLCVKATTVFVQPVWYKFQLFGWEIDRLESVLDRAFDSLVIGTGKRFWTLQTRT